MKFVLLTILIFAFIRMYAVNDTIPLTRGTYNIEIKITGVGLDTSIAFAEVNLPNNVAGLNYKFYKGDWSMMPNFALLVPESSGIVQGFDTKSPYTEKYAFDFTGFIEIEKSASYTFYTLSDDGSFLYIDGALVVNNDGLHGAVEKSGAKTLTTGRHTIRVSYFQRSGGRALSVSYSAPSIVKQLIPNSILFNQ